MSDAAAGHARWDERHRAREAALRALYQSRVGHVDLSRALELVADAGDDDSLVLDDASRAFALRLAQGVASSETQLDAEIGPHCTNWRLERLATLDHLVLRLAVREWLAEPTTPPRVVLSEALELARVYSGEAAVKFVNGVLDAIYRRLRTEGRIID